MELTWDGRIIIFGGCTTDDKGYPSYLADVWSLDVETMVWTRPRTEGAEVAPRFQHASCMVGKYLVSVGGFVQHADRRLREAASASDGVGRKLRKPTRSENLLAFDTEALAWVRPASVGNCPDAVYGHALAVAGDQLVVFGGWGGNRALDELFVGAPLAAFARALDEQRAADADAHAEGPTPE